MKLPHALDSVFIIGPVVLVLVALSLWTEYTSRRDRIAVRRQRKLERKWERQR